jgi:hypothetical protein
VLRKRQIGEGGFASTATTTPSLGSTLGREQRRTKGPQAVIEEQEHARAASRSTHIIPLSYAAAAAAAAIPSNTGTDISGKKIVYFS